MTEEESNDLQGNENKNRRYQKNKKEKLDKTLNYLIALVVVLIGISLFVIFSIQEEPEELAEDSLATEEDQENEDMEPADIESAGAEEPDEQSEDTLAETEAGQDDSGGTTDVIVESVNKENVIERWTSEQWEPYPTEQQGEHTSTFQKGHIDYVEKIDAVFSVLPIAKADSIVWSMRNNGDAKSARAVVSNKNKTDNYRVMIEWVESEGWKPVVVEVLTTIDGMQ